MIEVSGLPPIIFQSLKREAHHRNQGVRNAFKAVRVRPISIAQARSPSSQPAAVWLAEEKVDVTFPFAVQHLSLVFCSASKRTPFSRRSIDRTHWYFAASLFGVLFLLRLHCKVESYTYIVYLYYTVCYSLDSQVFEHALSAFPCSSSQGNIPHDRCRGQYRNQRCYMPSKIDSGKSAKGNGLATIHQAGLCCKK